MSEKDEFRFPDEEENAGTENDDTGFENEPEEWQDEKKLRKALKKAERKKKSSSSRILLLVLLLVVLAGAAYFYLMGTPQPEPPPPPPKVVKKQPIAVPPPPQKEEPAPAPAPAPAEPQQAAAKPEAEAAGEQAAPAEPVAADAEASAEGTGGQEDVPAEESVAAQAPVATEPPAEGTYAVQVGAYLLKANLAAAMEKLAAMGYEPRVEEGSKGVEMTRLRLGTFPPDEAEARMDELSRSVPGVFSLPGEGGVVVYAGSYYNLDRARVLADRLYRQGIRLEEETVEIEVPLYQLSIGGFSDAEQARQAADRAREAGLDAYVSREG